MAETQDPGRDFRKARLTQLRARSRLLTDTRAEILRLLKIAANQVRYTLGTQPSEIEQINLKALQREIARAMAEFSEAAGARLGTAAGAAWQLGQDLVDQSLAAGQVRIAALLPVLDTRQLTAMRSFMTDRIDNIGLQAQNKINTRLGLTMIGAQPMADTISAIDAVLGGESRDRAITITRTELSRAYAVAAQERAVQAATVVPGLKKQWRRSGKVHSRLNHDLMDGVVVDVDQPFKLVNAKGEALEMMFPHDPKAPAAEVINCGCTVVPWKEDWDMKTPGRRKFSAAELDAMPEKAVALDRLAQGWSLREVVRGRRDAA